MSRLFVEQQPVPVYEVDHNPEIPPDRQNVVYIKPKMSYGERAIYNDTYVHQVRGEKIVFREYEARMVMLKLNVVRWDGPDFHDQMGRLIPCTPENIEKADPTEPFWLKVLREIDRRNAPKEATPDDPNGGTQASPTSTNDTSPGSEESAQLQEASGT